MAYPEYLPYVTSVTDVPSEGVLNGYARMLPEHGEDTNYLPPGYGLESPEIFIDGGKKTTKFNSQIVSIFNPTEAPSREESNLIRRARMLQDEAGRMHPVSCELVWGLRAVPNSARLLPNQYKTECLGLHQLNNILEATNLIGEDIINKQIDNVLTQGTASGLRSDIANGLWAIYKDETIDFQKPKAAPAMGYDPDPMRTNAARGWVSGVSDEPRKFVMEMAPTKIERNTVDKSTALLYQLYLHFLQDPEFDVLKTGYMTWVDGLNENSQRWEDMKNKIDGKIQKNLSSVVGVDKLEAGRIASGLMTALGKLDFNMLIGLSADLMRFAIQFSGIARHSVTEIHDMNPIFASLDMANRDATHQYVVFTVGRHKVYPLAPPCKGYAVKTYYWRPSKYSFFRIDFRHETSLRSFRQLIHPREYYDIEDVEVEFGESIYTDEYEGDIPYYTPEEQFSWRQGFPHFALDRMDEYPGSAARRASYITERQASVALHRSLHSNY